MKKNRKRLMAILLAGVMVFSISTMSMADTDTVGAQETSDESGVTRNEADDTSAESADSRALEANAERTEAAGEDPEDGIMMLRADGTPITQSDISGGSLTLDQDGAYYLAEDITASITIGSDSTVTLDLNGKTLTAGSDRPITVNGALTLTDSSATNEDGTDGEGKVTGGDRITDNITYGGGVYVASEATFELDAGSIEGTSIKTQYNRYVYGGGVYVGESGIFVMKGGIISNNTVNASADGSAYGGGVYVASEATFELDAGSIEGNSTIGDNDAYGGGVYVGESAEFDMNGGIISKNTAIAPVACGGGVYVASDATFTLDAGSIEGNSVEADDAAGGGGVYVDESGEFIMNDGSISENTAFATYGGGVFINYGSFVMLGGSITYNNAFRENTSSTNRPVYGGGVCLYQGTFTMYDGSITGNYISNGSGAGVSLFSKSTMEMSGGNIDSNSAKFESSKVSSQYFGVGVYAQNSSFSMSGGSISYNEGYEINGGGVGIMSNSEFYMSGGTISYNSVDGDTASYGNGGGVNAQGSVTVISPQDNNEISITDNYASSDGGGLSLQSDTVHVEGAVVENNTAGRYGGGIYFSHHNDNEGSISSCKIADNKATYGGGIYSNGEGTLKENFINNNTASDYGGGVYQQAYTYNTSRNLLTMDGDTISDNMANYGGGVCVYINGSSFEMNEGSIKNNTASKNGGGVYLYNSGSTITSHFTMTDGAITENSAQDGSGGGVYISASGELTMSGGSITENTASGDGGGVYIRASGGELTMSGGSITKNTASGDGGGVYQNGVYTISDSPVVTDNTSDNVYIPRNKYITIGDSLSGTKNIGVTTAETPDYASGIQFTDAGNQLYAESVPYFFSDNPKYFVRGNDGSQYDELAMVFAVTIDKVDGNDNPLDGAQFTLTDNAGSTVWFTVEEGEPDEPDIYTVCDEGTSDATSTITAGNIRMEGLDAAVNYTLTETDAPEGYKKLSAPIVFTVDRTTADATIVSGPEGVTCTSTDDKVNVITIPNSENASVSITKTADKDVYAIGETVTYTIDISQTVEDATATAVTFTDEVPDNVTVVRATATINGTTYTGLMVNGNTVSIPTSADLSLAQSDALQIVITGTATSAGTDITNTATVSASNADPASDTAAIAIVESASLPNAGGFGRGRLILAGLAVLLGGLEVLFVAVRKRRRI